MPVEYVSTPIIEKGVVAGAVIVFRDITERREAERAVEESQQRFRQLAEHINEVFWITDPTKDRIIYISPGYEETWGRSCESLYASPYSWMEAIHPEDRPRVTTAVGRQDRGLLDELLDAGERPRDVAELVGVSLATLYRRFPASERASNNQSEGTTSAT